MALGLSKRQKSPSIIHLGNYRNLNLPIDFTKRHTTSIPPRTNGSLKRFFSERAGKLWEIYTQTSNP